MEKEINPNYKWLALSVTSLGALLSVLNGNTLLIALPVVMRDLNASVESITWALMIYLLAITILVPSIGRVADMVGRKQLYVGGFALFTVAAFALGFIQNGTQLIVGRLIQAIGGSLMLANSTAIVTDAFPQGQLGRALGINSMIIAIASIIGPILGGVLVTINWRLIFFFNVPLGIIGTIWAQAQVRELVKLPAGQRFDWLGTALFTVGFTLILLGITIGSISGWTPLWIAAIVVGLALMVGFVYVEGHTDQPMLDLSLFKKRLLAAAYATNFLNGIARGSITFLLIFYFQGPLGIDPLQAGLLLIPFAAAMMVVAPISGMLSDRFGSRELSFAGLAIAAVGIYGYTHISLTTPMSQIVLWMVITGIGSGLFASPNTNAIMGAVSPQRRGIAAGTRTMMNNAGSVISIGLGMAMIASTMSPAALQGLFAGTQVGSQGITLNEFFGGLHNAFMLSFIISAVAAIVSLLRGPHQVYNPGEDQASPTSSGSLGYSNQKNLVPQPVDDDDPPPQAGPTGH
jgi:EmrB/QacA subfamily drug resistance transporter